MFLIVGLGNPGEKYQNNRHNIGFRVVDLLVKNLDAARQNVKDFQGELYKSSQILLLKPKTFMNLSGESVWAVLKFYKIKNFLTIHDDLDLPFGTIKFKFGGGNGGHNGLKSIDMLCGNNYYRVRYGIGKPTTKTQITNWVLQDFTSLEEEQNKTLITHSANAVLEITKLNSNQELAEKISSKWTLSPAKDSKNLKNLSKEIE